MNWIVSYCMRFYGKYANIFGKKDIFYIFLNVIVYVPYKSIEVNCNTLTHTKKRLHIGTMRDFNIFRFFVKKCFFTVMPRNSYILDLNLWCNAPTLAPLSKTCTVRKYTISYSFLYRNKFSHIYWFERRRRLERKLKEFFLQHSAMRTMTI